MAPRIDFVQTLEGVTVYRDETRYNVYYLVPEQPRFRIDQTTRLPVFKFIKYRFPIDRPDGRKGGGYCAFDIEFAVADDKLARIKEQLQGQLNQYYAGWSNIPQVEIGSLTYLKGTARLVVAGANGAFVEKLYNPTGPSLFGNNITTYGVELTPEGATFFEQALQGKGSSTVGVEYGLTFMSRLPPINATLSFRSEQFYSFFQQVDYDWEMWASDTYRETIREQLIQSESIYENFDWGGLTDQNIKNQIRNSLLTSFEDAIQKKIVEAIPPFPADQRGVPEDIEHVTRDISNSRISSFTQNYHENMPYEQEIRPQGQLPTITSLTGPDGKPLNWADFGYEADLYDDFFKTLDVSVRVNADFNKLPIDSIEVKLQYQDEQPSEYRFMKPDDIAKFRSYTENDVWKYRYSYQVNYKGEAQIFQSEDKETDERVLTVNVDDLGVLSVDILPGDLNFAQISQAQITMQYQNGGEPIEQQYIMDQNHKEHLFQQVLFEPVKAPYTYKVKYFMQDGREFELAPREGRSPQLYISDPFSVTKTVSLRAAGNLDTVIDNIFVDLVYEDARNNYRQTHTVALSKASPFFDWSFPVIDEQGGKVGYSGSIRFKDGTIQEIGLTEATRPTILIGEIVADTLDVTIVPDLLDFSKIKLVKTSLHYQDAANSIDERKDFILKQGSQMATWSVKLKDKTKNSYTWQATYFMGDGSKRDTPEASTSDLTLILELPA
jgi:hypothetical protein